MSENRFSRGEGPDWPHIEYSHREVRDLRNDVESMLARVAQELDTRVKTLELSVGTISTGSAVVTVSVKDSRGGDLLPVVERFDLLVCDDLDLVTPSMTGGLDSETAGSILDGRGTNGITAKSGATGEFTCVLSGSGTFYIAADRSFASSALDCPGPLTVVIP